MNISPEQLEEFKEIYKKKFGKELSNQEAYDKGLKIIRFLLIADDVANRHKDENNKAM